MKNQWSDRKRKIVAFITVNFGMLGGFVLAAFLVPRETKLRTFLWICTAFFVLGNIGLGMKLRKPITGNAGFNGKRAWVIIGLSVIAVVLKLLWR
jgi:hypothetical protein